MTSEPHPISTHIWIFPARFPPQMQSFRRSPKPFTSLLPGSKKAPKHDASEQLWCRWRGSNPHELLAQRILSPPRLPIPTHRQIFLTPNRASPEFGGIFRRDVKAKRKTQFKKRLILQDFSLHRRQTAKWILSPPRLPIPTHRQIYFLTPRQAFPGIWRDMQEGC